MALRLFLFFGFALGVLYGQRASAQQAATKTAAAPPSPAPKTATPPIDVSAKNRVAPEEPPNSWTDPRIIAELAKNCNFDPLRDKREWLPEDLGAGSTHPLTCLSGRDQSCVPDPCFTDMSDRGCRARCEKTCDSCGAGCGSACNRCKATCKDDTCRQDCAKQCAVCHVDCVRAVDRCSSGKCANEYNACRARLKADWNKNGCAKVCDSVRGACVTQCTRKKAKDIDDCAQWCIDERKSPNPRCDLRMCVQMKLGE